MRNMSLTPVIGLMAGTSVDGIDASLVMTDGEKLIRTGLHATTEMRPETRVAILAAVENPDPGDTRLARLVAEDHIEAVRTLMARTDIIPELIGFHGQTILHAPEEGRTVQIGDAAYIAKTLGVDVIYDFRQKDMESGGQGAPLAPVYHLALMEELGLELPAAVVNIGGITNVTIWDGITLSGFDTGPGNGLMDAEMRHRTGKNFDEYGNIARSGTKDEAWIRAALTHPFFTKPPPKSLDRKALDAMLRPDELKGHCLEDAMATLTSLTAESLAAGLLAANPLLKSVILAGGGAANPTLVEMIRDKLPVAVTTMEDHGLASGLIEAELMAFLAMRSRRGLPLSFPGTTGVDRPMTGGRLAPAASILPKNRIKS